MAKIAYVGQSLPFYESVLADLKQAGHDVLHFPYGDQATEGLASPDSDEVDAIYIEWAIQPGRGIKQTTFHGPSHDTIRRLRVSDSPNKTVPILYGSLIGDDHEMYDAINMGALDAGAIGVQYVWDLFPDEVATEIGQLRKSA